MRFIKKNKFKILGITFLCIIFFSIFSKTLGADYESMTFKEGIVTAKTLNVRCGPRIRI